MDRSMDESNNVHRYIRVNYAEKWVFASLRIQGIRQIIAFICRLFINLPYYSEFYFRYCKTFCSISNNNLFCNCVARLRNTVLHHRVKVKKNERDKIEFIINFEYVKKRTKQLLIHSHKLFIIFFFLIAVNKYHVVVIYIYNY